MFAKTFPIEPKQILLDEYKNSYLNVNRLTFALTILQSYILVCCPNTSKHSLTDTDWDMRQTTFFRKINVQYLLTKCVYIKRLCLDMCISKFSYLSSGIPSNLHRILS